MVLCLPLLLGFVTTPSIARSAADKMAPDPNAWLKSKHGDELLAIAAKAGVDRRTLALATCACVRLSLKHVQDGENRPRVAIEAAERWAREDREESKPYDRDVTATLVANAVRNAAAAASYAASTTLFSQAGTLAAFSSAASAAAGAASLSSSAYVIAASADAKAAAVDDDPVYAAAYNARNVAYQETLSQCAAIVRKMIPFRLVEAANRGK